MRLVHFSLGGLRVFAEADFFPGPGLNFITGANGSGKTSVLEAVFLLSQGRSFRSPQIESVLRSGCDTGWAFGEFVLASGESRRIGVSRVRGGAWDVRIDGARSDRVASLAGVAPMLCFEPGAHAWVSGPAERRRRLLDWGVFHVERRPLALWTGYLRALKQRNEALRLGDQDLIRAWEPGLIEAGEAVDEARRAFLDDWLPRVHRQLAWLFPELPELRIDYRRGWGRAHAGLGEALLAQRERDRSQGFTGSGPQRAELALRIEDAEARERLSRGQSKIVSLAMLLGLAEAYAERHGSMPLLLLDDLCSELDQTRVEAVLAWLRNREVQALISGVAVPDGAHISGATNVFHVERGSLTPLL